MAEREGVGRRGPGATGVLVIVALIAIAGAWLVTTFWDSMASAAGSTQERVALVFMSDEEEIEQAARDYIEAFSYEGSNGSQWRQKMETTIVPKEYYETERGESYRELTQTVNEEDSTFRWSLEFEQWELEEKTGTQAIGAITYEGSHNWESEKPESFQSSNVEMRLAKTDEGWKVTSEGG